jgi:diguanylate cyclase (GGDEF)-like protein
MWRSHDTTPGPEACRSRERLQRERLKLLFAMTPVILAVNLVNGTLIAGVFLQPYGPKRIAVWWGLLAFMVALRGCVWLWYRRHGGSNRWLSSVAIAGSGASGLLWGAASILFYPQSNETHLIVLGFVLGGMGAGAVASLNAYLPAFYIYLIPSLVPFCALLALEGDPDHFVMAAACAMYMIALAILGQQTNRWLTASIRHRFKNINLIRSLESRVEERTRKIRQVNEQLRRDIAERQRAESTLAEYGERQAAVAEFSRMALSEFDLDMLFHTAVLLVRNRLSVASAAVVEDTMQAPKFGGGVADGLEVAVPSPQLTVPVLADHAQAALHDPAIKSLVDAVSADASVDLQRLRLTANTAEVAIAGHGRVLLAADSVPHQFSANDISFLQSIANVLAAAIARKRAEQEVQLLALQDPLTGLPNRVLFRSQLDQELIRARRSKRMFAVLIIDLDHFKDVNDTLGHPIGDRLLAAVAARLKACLREMDAPARLGGDEFAVVLSNLRAPEDAASIARKIVRHLSAPFFLDSHELHIGASVGITISPDDAADVDGLLRNADLALYRAKTEGRNTHKFYAADMAERVEARKAIEHDLRYALQRDELYLEYQPQFELASGCLVGAEALVRWQHPNRGLLMPDAFVPIAEATGLILPMGRWVLERIGMQMRAWKQAGLPPIVIAMNVSLNQCLRGDLVALVEDLALRTACGFDWLELEVTEQFFMSSGMGDTVAVLRQLSGLGVTISIDDFGTGYSSLGRLRRLPVNKVKIDRSFIEELGKSRDAEMLVCAVIALGRSLGMKVTAEGVENNEQLAFLTARGCDYAQGFHLGMPLSENDLATLLQNSRGECPANAAPRKDTARGGTGLS